MSDASKVLINRSSVGKTKIDHGRVSASGADVRLRCRRTIELPQGLVVLVSRG